MNPSAPESAAALHLAPGAARSAAGSSVPSRHGEVTAAGLAADLAGTAQSLDEQLESMFHAAQTAGWDGPAAAAYLAQLAAVTQASGVIWLLQSILRTCGPETADEMARGLSDAWSGAVAAFETAAAGLASGSRPGAQP